MATGSADGDESARTGAAASRHERHGKQKRTLSQRTGGPSGATRTAGACVGGVDKLNALLAIEALQRREDGVVKVLIQP
jgi:hypothetical protein